MLHTTLRSYRETIGLSQSKLARLSGVSRFKICLFELGDGKLTPEEQKRISAALHAETERLHNLPTPDYLQAAARIAKYGSESPDPAEAQAAAIILARDLARGLENGGRPPTNRSWR
jgi:transcriptional regulator with XRE-family HTH domain